jgi:hypothetical protein
MNVALYLIKYYVVKEYKPVVVKSHIFVTSAQNGD